MPNLGLLFIPDISGFTRFVNQTDIEHSRLIIQELLEILINSNEIGLEVSEIEGDAILFYKFGDSPDLKEIYHQVETMFCKFHEHLLAYDLCRYCQCDACISAANLTLKVITHYGEFTNYTVHNFQKLIGKDIIVAHQLLKNDIDQHEYWLVTNNLVHEDPPAWIEWNTSEKETESGAVAYHYTYLTHLKEQITPPSLPKLEVAEKSKMFSLTRMYDTDLITLFHAVGDFNYRNRWHEGIKGVEQVAHILPRIGTHCRFIYDSGEVTMHASSYSFEEGRIEFSETDDKKKSSTYYTLTQVDRLQSELTIDYYIAKNPLSEFFFKLTKKKSAEQELERSLEKLETLVRELEISGY